MHGSYQVTVPDTVNTVAGVVANVVYWMKVYSLPLSVVSLDTRFRLDPELDQNGKALEGLASAGVDNCFVSKVSTGG